MNSSLAGPEASTNLVGFDIKSILNLDDFEEFRARASSGGSVYGMLRRHAFLRGPSRTGPGPGHRPMQRQRSRSLIQRSVALPEDKSILKMLCDYSEKKKLMKENRRHSEAALSYNRAPPDFPSARQGTSPIRLKRTLTPKYSRAPASAVPVPSQVPEEDSMVPGQAASLATSGQTLNQPEMTKLTLGPPAPSSRNICRRRSFSLTQYGLVNDGDEVVTLPTSPGTSFIPTNAFDGCMSTVPCGPAQRSRAASVFSPEAAVLFASNSRTSISADTPMHRVLMLGGPGVGKTALTQQFVTSEYMAAQNTSFGKLFRITDRLRFGYRRPLVRQMRISTSAKWKELAMNHLAGEQRVILKTCPKHFNS